MSTKPSNIVPFASAPMACPLPVGSRVALRGGSQVMTVIVEFPPNGTEKEWWVNCAWHNDVGDSIVDSYPVEALYVPATSDVENGKAAAAR
jgi:hypothetical protein